MGGTQFQYRPPALHVHALNFSSTSTVNLMASAPTLNMVKVMHKLATDDYFLYTSIQKFAQHKLAKSEKEQQFVDSLNAGLDQYGRLTDKQRDAARNMMSFQQAGFRKLFDMKLKGKRADTQPAPAIETPSNDSNDSNDPPF